MRPFRFSRAVVIAVAVVVVGLFVWRLWPGPEPAADDPGDIDDEAPVELDPHQRAAPVPSRSPRPAPTTHDQVSPTGQSGPPGLDAVVLPPGPYRRPSPDDCDDGDPCTRRDRVVGSECRGEAFTCDDGNPLTTDECTGEGCLFRPVPGVTRPALE